MKKYYNVNNTNLKKIESKLNITKLHKMALEAKIDVLKYKYIKMFDLSLNSTLKYEIIDSIDDLKIKNILLNEYFNQLEFSQLAEIIMNIKNENEKNKLLKEYSFKLKDKIYDIIGNSFILKDNETYSKNYIEFAFIIFTYVVASNSNINLKKVFFNEKLKQEEKSGTSYKGTIDFCPLNYEALDFYDYTDLINTVYHEIEHEIQNKLICEKISINNLNYRYLKMIKERLIIRNHSYYDIGNTNYQLEVSEVDARINSYIKTFNFISKYSKDKSKIYLKDIKNEITLNRKLKNILIRLKCDEILKTDNNIEYFTKFNNLDDENKIILDDMFEASCEVEKYLKEYPLLTLEYDKYGNRIETEEIVDRLLNCYKILSNRKYKKCDLKIIESLKYFYINLLDDRNKIKKLKK